MPTNDDSAQPCFEDSLAELESIVHDLEEGQLGLAQALARYEQGVKHLNNCYQLLQAAERKIELLTGITDEGVPLTQPFADESAGPLPESAGRRRRAKSTRPAANPPGDTEEHEQA